VERSPVSRGGITGNRKPGSTGTPKRACSGLRFSLAILASTTGRLGGHNRRLRIPSGSQDRRRLLLNRFSGADVDAG
jgi:hypothetical protein